MGNYEQTNSCDDKRCSEYDETAVTYLSH